MSWQGKTVTEITTKWESSIVVGRKQIDLESWYGWDAGAWNLDEMKVDGLDLVSNASNPAGSSWGASETCRSCSLCEPKPTYVQR